MQLSGQDHEYINNYADSVLEILHERMVHKGLDRIKLPPTSLKFSRRRVGVTWHGEAVLTNGYLKGLETISRTGQSKLTIGIDGVSIDVGIGLFRTEMAYDIHATFMNHGPKGTITGKLSHITCDVQLFLPHGSDRLELHKLRVREIGHLKAKITGLGSLLNFIVSRIAQMVGNRVKWEVSNMLEGVIKDMLNDIISKKPLPIDKLLLFG